MSVCAPRDIPAREFSVDHVVVRGQSGCIEGVVVRECRDESELEQLYLAIGRQFAEEWQADDRRLDEPRRRFDSDHELMLALVDCNGIRGGVIAFGDDEVTVRALGIDAELRGYGRGRRLLELIEARALVRGARRIILGAADEAGGFYERLGYRGKRTMREKQLPPPGAVRSRLVARAADVVEHLPSGIQVG
ncbi:MAG: GNAT family N-acetyltransferase [Actinomycetota bacterium]|nr:GNAT family N-acetyltransferase [Actinomycetota bacterium]